MRNGKTRKNNLSPSHRINKHKRHIRGSLLFVTSANCRRRMRSSRKMRKRRRISYIYATLTQLLDGNVVSFCKSYFWLEMQSKALDINRNYSDSVRYLLATARYTPVHNVPVNAKPIRRTGGMAKFSEINLPPISFRAPRRRSF